MNLAAAVSEAATLAQQLDTEYRQGKPAQDLYKLAHNLHGKSAELAKAFAVVHIPTGRPLVETAFAKGA